MFFSAAMTNLSGLPLFIFLMLLLGSHYHFLNQIYLVSQPSMVSQEKYLIQILMLPYFVSNLQNNEKRIYFLSIFFSSVCSTTLCLYFNLERHVTLHLLHKMCFYSDRYPRTYPFSCVPFFSYVRSKRLSSSIQLMLKYIRTK